MTDTTLQSGADKIAVLVMAYRAPAVLRRTVSLFQDKSFQFYIHVDRKAPIESFDFLGEFSNVKIIPERHNIFWGGFNMMRAEFALLSHAISNPECEKFILISDDSFPLRAPDVIRNALFDYDLWIDQHVPTNQYFLNRYRNFYCYDTNFSSPQYLRPEQRIVSPEDLDGFRDMEQLFWKGKKPLERMFQGSQWWCLSRAATSYVLQIVAEDFHLHESFRFSAVPDEQYIQTIIGNAGREWKTNWSPIYSEFSRDPKPFIFSNFDDLESAMQSDKLFVRKVASDEHFLETLSKKILEFA